MVSGDLKNAALAVLSLALFAGFANHRAEHAIVHDLRNTLHGGQLRAEVRPQGLLGLLTGRVDAVRVSGSNLSANDIPFRVHRGPGVRANADTLEFDLQNITLRGTLVRRFSVAFPDVSLDAGRALFDERIILRRSGVGSAKAEVDAAALVAFIERKYRALKQVTVDLKPGFATVRGLYGLLGTPQQVEATGRLALREGRFLDLVDPVVLLSGRPAPLSFAQAMARQVNPIVDLDTDLGLARIFQADSLEIGDGHVVVKGRAVVPPAGPIVKEKKL